MHMESMKVMRMKQKNYDVATSKVIDISEVKWIETSIAPTLCERQCANGEKIIVLHHYSTHLKYCGHGSNDFEEGEHPWKKCYGIVHNGRRCNTF
jgi:hypothetical protein